MLGYDVAGVVDAVGSEVTLFAPGDDVIASASRPETVEWGKKLGAHTNGSKQERLLGRPCWKAFSNDCRLWPPRGVVCAAS
ncbi:alcohol dehydrogenase catalytic domain-containing protein [Paraburkholderia fungorum]|uniref:alcohol dehydrogenase catalytic domain-containing protein n=1 Tax=Paraburkholderia fungorum TaxID=134537 RepID=UPI003B97665D